MKTKLIAAVGVLLLGACGADPNPDGEKPKQHSSSSISSVPSASSSSVSSVVPLNYLPCGICDEDELSGQLVVISSQRYQQKLTALFDIPEDYSEFELARRGLNGRYIGRFGGRTLFSDDEFTSQRMQMAVTSFYNNAALVASNHSAVECVEISAIECGESFINEFVEPLFERSLTDIEREHYLRFFMDAAEPDQDGQRAAMTAALTSPNFLFRKVAADEQ